MRKSFFVDLSHAENFTSLRFTKESNGHIRWSMRNPDGSVATGTATHIPEALNRIEGAMKRVTGRLRAYGFPENPLDDDLRELLGEDYDDQQPFQ